MPADRFLDTNIPLYAYNLDSPTKRSVAMAIVEEAWRQPGRTALSVQVLQEFHPKSRSWKFSLRMKTANFVG